MAIRAAPQTVRALLAHLVRTELRLLIGLAGVCIAVWGFFSVMGEVREGDTYRLDRALLLALRRPGDLQVPIGPRWLQETARDVTALGGFTVLALVVAAAFALLLIHRRRAQAWVLLAAVLLGQGLAELVKQLMGRARPDLVPHLDQVYSSSFPSGHSAMSPVVYFTLAGILAAGEPDRAAKAVILGGAAALVFAIGVSRVYLGVHWPTDVLAGWAMGTAVALAATLVLHALAPHRARRAGAPQETPVASSPAP
ncbi:MAG TPA: phosphatase PAP2 family protein [Phenylobacterium sp.]|uniref:phosphatase PAP2 family protein n=1 Tax=Phenylobacterium sp. TaxID=1871053 RepID=UPI002C50C181|nr:phosphatase PAP2 family protein [Phenylobacterium sp.]HSV04529.1 phosphatase PAP2 family protein [Phenylobacterium sp.]